jgi:predicted amidophosphoribosyltransferase
MTIATINPKKLGPGPWVEGYVLDYHSISSTPTGDPYYRFDTKRTQLGELLYRLKYRNVGGAVLTDIADTVEHFVKSWHPPIEAITGAPPSRNRATQPVVELVREVGKRLGLPVIEGAIVKSKVTPQMKDIDDWAERQQVLGEAVQAGNISVKHRSVLLLDDLTESGSTLRRSAQVLLDEGQAKAVYALALTRTR